MGLTGITAIGLHEPISGKIYLAVWRADTTESDICIPLKKYGMTGAQLIYPFAENENNGLTWHFASEKAELILHFTRQRQARFFMLNC